jgi:hypothetical protein
MARQPLRAWDGNLLRSAPCTGHGFGEAASMQDKPLGSYADTQPMVYRVSQPRDARTYVGISTVVPFFARF